MLTLAEREASKMLAENLLGRFKATDEYKELAGELVAGLTASPGVRVRAVGQSILRGRPRNV